VDLDRRQRPLRHEHGDTEDDRSTFSTRPQSACGGCHRPMTHRQSEGTVKHATGEGQADRAGIATPADAPGNPRLGRPSRAPRGRLEQVGVAPCGHGRLQPGRGGHRGLRRIGDCEQADGPNQASDCLAPSTGSILERRIPSPKKRGRKRRRKHYPPESRSGSSVAGQSHLRYDLRSASRYLVRRVRYPE